LLVTVNDKLKSEIEIVHDLSCHPIFWGPLFTFYADTVYNSTWFVVSLT